MALLTYTPLTPAQLVQVEKGMIFAIEELGLSHSLMVGLIRHESYAQPFIVSNKGAVGLMQVIPSTGDDMGENVYTIEGNIRAGAKYLHMLINKYGTVYDALIAYNAGPRRYREWKKAGTVPHAPKKYAMNIIERIK